jgi:hypothetical protein
MVYLIALAVGIILGWNVLPQPAWAKKLWDRYMSKLKQR